MELDALSELARAHAIDLEYYDIWGNLHRASPESLRGVFAAMGIDASNDRIAAQRLQQALAARWREIVPPAMVLRVDATARTVRLHLDRSRYEQTLRWTIQEEHGPLHAAEFTPAALTRCGEASIDSELRIAVELELRLPLPIGYHQFTLYAQQQPLATALLAIVPQRCYTPPAIERGERVWGIAAQLYAVRSARNWGIGDYSDLRALVEFWGERGAGIIGVNPQHAPYTHDPDHCSPYSPNSRIFKNWLYIDVEACADFATCAAARALVASAAFQDRLRALRAADLVDYRGVGQAKREVLELLYAAFRAHELPASSERACAFRDFQRDSGVALRNFALFEALQEHLGTEGRCNGWQSWPQEFHDPTSAAVQGFCVEHLERVEFFEYVQWIATIQLDAAGRRCLESGLAVGLYEDLAVSADRGGAETWVNQRTFALTASVGAPPDELNLRGQNWGLPPTVPARLRAARYAPFIEALRANMRHAGALRVDHVMALMRLYWIPADASGADGIYVRYPFADLLGLVALESQRNRCMLIGEDLGTVPDEVRHGLEAAGVLSYRVIYFERDESGNFKPPDWYPQQALVVATTHDLPTVAGWWRGRDIAVRTALDLYPNEAVRATQIAGRDADRRRLLAVLARAGLLPPGTSEDPDMLPELSAEVITALHAYLATTPACTMTVQLEDLLGATEQVNVPGTVAEYPNWRRKLTLELEQFGSDSRIDAMVRVLAAIRPRGAF